MSTLTSITFIYTRRSQWSACLHLYTIARHDMACFLKFCWVVLSAMTDIWVSVQYVVQGRSPKVVRSNTIWLSRSSSGRGSRWLRVWYLRTVSWSYSFRKIFQVCYVFPYQSSRVVFLQLYLGCASNSERIYSCCLNRMPTKDALVCSNMWCTVFRLFVWDSFSIASLLVTKLMELPSLLFHRDQLWDLACSLGNACCFGCSNPGASGPLWWSPIFGACLVESGIC